MKKRNSKIKTFAATHKVIHTPNRPALSMVELVIAMALSIIVILAVATLLASGQQSWQRIFDSVNSETKNQAQDIMLTFSAVGRKSNTKDYHLYKQNGNSFTPAQPTGSQAVEVVTADAVEFRYWDVPLDQSDSHNLLDTSKTATAYALFYLDGDEFKVDYGQYPPGAVPDGGGSRNTSNIVTQVLAENVSTDPNSGVGPMSHTTINGLGQGSVRINLTLTDPDNGQTVDVMTSVMLRNKWPN